MLHGVSINWVNRKKWCPSEGNFSLLHSDKHLEHVWGAESAFDKWTEVSSLFQRRILLNCLTARPQFYSAKLVHVSHFLAFHTKKRQLAADWNAMSDTITDQQLCMTFVYCLPQRIEHLILFIHTTAKYGKLTVAFVERQLLQEEQRMNTRTADYTETDGVLLSTGASNLSSRSIPTCTCCNILEHLEAACWTNYLHLNPEQIWYIVKSGSEATDEADEHICLAATTSLLYALHCSWVTNSEPAVHMAYHKAVFFKMERVNPLEVGIGELSSV